MSEDDIYPLVYLAQLGNNGFPFHLATDELAKKMSLLRFSICFSAA